MMAKNQMEEEWMNRIPPWTESQFNRAPKLDYGALFELNLESNLTARIL